MPPWFSADHDCHGDNFGIVDVDANSREMGEDCVRIGSAVKGKRLVVGESEEKGQEARAKISVSSLTVTLHSHTYPELDNKDINTSHPDITINQHSLSSPGSYTATRQNMFSTPNNKLLRPSQTTQTLHHKHSSRTCDFTISTPFLHASYLCSRECNHAPISSSNLVLTR